MTRYLGIDYGLERTGLALTDPEGRLAFPLGTLRLAKSGTRKALLDELAALIREHRAEAIVIGLPLNEDDSENPRCRQVRNFAGRLQRRVDLPVYFVTEYLSSQAAAADLADCGRKGKKMRAVLDQQAACIILETYLNQADSA